MAAGPGSGLSPWGGDGESQNRVGRKTYAEMLGSTLSPGVNKNVLEVVLEKDQRGSFVVSHQECARVMSKIGLDARPGVHVEAVQICPNGRGIILITLKQEINIASFCRHEVFEVTSSGIRVVNIRPVGKRDAVVTIKGLHPNTRDEFVLAYLNKFAKSVTNKVIHGVYADGPLKGLKNGDRSFKLEIKPSDNIGTYHILDGHKVTLRYAGQQQTCARCHETARNCKGGAMAKRCEAAGGVKVELSDYITKLWKEIGYEPEVVELAAVYDDHGDHEDAQVTEQAGGEFTPVKAAALSCNFGGVSIRQFPKETDSGEIMEFLVSNGLPESLRDNVHFKPRGRVVINGLDHSICKILIEEIHTKIHFNKKLFCDGIVPLTPQKDETSPQPMVSATQPHSSAPPLPPPVATSLCPSSAAASTPAVTSLSPRSSAAPTSLATASTNMSQPVVASTCQNTSSTSTSMTDSTPCLSNPIMSTSIGDVRRRFNSDFDMRLNDEDLVRRNSLSLRSPPPGSIASEILAASQSHDNVPLRERSKHLLASLKDLNEQLSNFGSARESLTSSSDEHSTVEDPGSFQNVRKKRKHSRTPPSKDFFLKRK